MRTEFGLKNVLNNIAIERWMKSKNGDCVELDVIPAICYNVDVC